VDCRSQVSGGRPGTPAEMAAAKADFNRLTEAASQLMDSGELDVYSLKQAGTHMSWSLGWQSKSHCADYAGMQLRVHRHTQCFTMLTVPSAVNRNICYLDRIQMELQLCCTYPAGQSTTDHKFTSDHVCAG
jgi:hypothetical protein